MFLITGIGVASTEYLEEVHSIVVATSTTSLWDHRPRRSFIAMQLPAFVFDPTHGEGRELSIFVEVSPQGRTSSGLRRETRPWPTKASTESDRLHLGG